MRSLYLLDETFRQPEIFDSYESLIWTERFSEPGEFELKVPASVGTRGLFPEGRTIAINDSYRVMVVESIDEEPTDTGVILTISGTSLEAIVSGRVGRTTPSGSPKTWVYRLVYQALRLGTYSVEDRFLDWRQGTQKFYYPSDIAPTTLPAPYENDGWVNIGEAWAEASKTSGIGFRILREPNTGNIYFDTYTGTDRTNSEKPDLKKLKPVWWNPYFYDTDDDVEVWRNIAHNPGFTNGYRPLAAGKYLRTAGTMMPTEVKCEWSKSGSGLKVDSPDDRTSDSTYALLTSSSANISPTLFGQAWRGKTFTASAKVEILDTQVSPHAQARSIVAYHSTSASSLGTILAESKAPNTVGVHSVSITFTIPSASSSVRWSLALWNGNGGPDDGVIWGDFCLVELPSNPVGYFDTGYSPDSDLTPAALRLGVVAAFGDTLYRPILTGKRILGVTAMVNCVLIQSGTWGVHDPVSARLIRNVPAISQMYATLTFPTGTTAKRAQITTMIEEPFTTVTSNLGRVELVAAGGSSLMSTSRPNTTGIVETDLTWGGNTATRMNLHGGFMDLGGSIWWGRALTTADTSGYYDSAENRVQPVVFSEDLNNFVVSNSRISIGGYKNVAYVTHRETLMILDDGYPLPGLLRRVVHVDASSLDAGSELRKNMLTMGMKALSEHRRTSVIDGEVPIYATYVYDEDYGLGDIVKVRDRTGSEMFARVVEQIFISDAEGERSYPTLAEETASVDGTWYAPEYNVFWAESAHLGTWADQP